MRENDQEKVTVYRTPAKTTLTNDGGLKKLDTQRDGVYISFIGIRTLCLTIRLKLAPEKPKREGEVLVEKLGKKKRN